MPSFSLGHELGQTQLLETRAAVNSPNNLKIVMVKFPGAKVPANWSLCDGFEPVNVSALDEQSAQECAATLTAKLNRQWVPIDDIPNEYLFDYEKDIIAAYSKGTIDPKLIGKGRPPSWPITERKPAVDETSPLKEEHVGRFRDWDYDADDYRKEEPLVLAAALNDLAQSTTNRLAFPRLVRERDYHTSVTPSSLTTGAVAVWRNCARNQRCNRRHRGAPDDVR